MAYDDKFFEMYAEYLQEPVVRANHDAALCMFDAFSEGRIVPHDVVDMGCGLGEYARWGTYGDYCGIDNMLRLFSPVSAVLPEFTASVHGITRDYLDQDIMSSVGDVATFVSMFSVEPIVPEEQRCAFYTNLFETCPTLKYGLSAGFYYASLPDHALVGEVGGIISHQTIDRPYEYPHPLFTETRVIMETPSKMFGKDVVEVYKMMKRIET